MQPESVEQTQSKNTKLIDNIFVVDMNQKLGGGSYSLVYASWCRTNPSEQLACKVISKVELDKQISQKKGTKQQKQQLKIYIIKRIKTEVEIGQKTKHPNIVQFVYFTETNNNIYIFMERCETNLEQFITTRGHLPENQAISVFTDIVSAACYLYDHNITHRDIKAQNILIKNGRVKLADFGFAKELRQKDNQEDGTGVGTRLYMAPQLIFEEKPVYSIRCDVWSIGVVMYFVIYGKLPWDQTQTLQSYHITLKKPIQFSPSIAISLKMKNLISRMLIFKDQQRINIKQVQLILDQLRECL